MNYLRIGIAVILASCLVVLSACGGGDSSSTDAASTGSDEATETSTATLSGGCGQLESGPPADDPSDLYAKVIEPLGTEISSAYEHYAGPLMETPYANFKADDGPWTIGYSDSFSGNAWRETAIKGIQANFAAAEEQGLVKGSLIVTDSNLKNEVQIQQMRSMVQKDVDLIFAIPGSPTALNGVIKEAYDAGIPVLTLNSPVTSPYAINVEMSGFLQGARLAQGIAFLLGGKGDIMTVQGISGAPANSQVEEGGNTVLATCPEIDVVDSFDGSWNNASAKTATLQALATHPEELDGVWEQGSMSKGIIEALEQQGRSVPPITMGTPDQAEVAYWQDHAADGYRASGSTSPSAAGADAMFRIGMRVMEGKGPKLNAFVGNPPLIIGTSEVPAAEKAFPGVEIQSLAEWENPAWTFDSPGVANPESGPEGKWLNDALLDKLFSEPGSSYLGIADAGQE